MRIRSRLLRGSGFLLKWDSDGAFVWVRQVFGHSGGNALAVGASGKIATAGWFSGTIEFSSTPGAQRVTGSDSQGVYVGEYDSDGNCLWAGGFAGAGATCNVSSVAIDSSGCVYSVGPFAGAVDFDPGAGVHSLTPTVTAAVYVNKLQADGSLGWAKQFSASQGGQVAVNGVAVDSKGAVYSGGYFDKSVDFEPGPSPHTLTAAGSWSSYVAKLNTDGAVNWVDAIGAAGSMTFVEAIAVDVRDQVYAFGAFSGTVDFDPGAGTHTLNSFGLCAFAEKVDTEGRFALVRGVGLGSGSLSVEGVALDPAGNIYLASQLSFTVDCVSWSSKTSMTAAGISDTVITKLKSTIIPGDITGDTVVDAVDVQLVINGALGLAIAGNADVNADNVVDAIDVQFTINSALGLN